MKSLYHIQQKNLVSFVSVLEQTTCGAIRLELSIDESDLQEKRDTIARAGTARFSTIHWISTIQLSRSDKGHPSQGEQRRWRGLQGKGRSGWW